MLVRAAGPGAELELLRDEPEGTLSEAEMEAATKAAEVRGGVRGARARRGGRVGAAKGVARGGSCAEGRGAVR